jgi:hypothetical protein
MGRKERMPRFKIGDIVVITLYGTVGTITAIDQSHGTYLYSVNNSTEYFLESTLHPISTFQGGKIELEQLEIEYKYYLGDLAFVLGYEHDIFKIVGIRTEIWRNKDGVWEEKSYELIRISDGEWLEADEEELILIADSDYAETFLQKLAFFMINNKQKNLEMRGMDMSKKSENEILRIKKEKRQIIDGLLDIYNDYKQLFDMFGDEKYKKVMEAAIENLKKHTKESTTELRLRNKLEDDIN